MVVGSVPDVELTTLADTAFDVSGYFTDDDGDRLVYRARSMDSTVARAIVSGTILQLDTYDRVGSTDIQVVATDPDTAEASHRFKVTAINQPPVVAQSIADRDLPADGTVAIDLEPYFTDPESQPLAYSAESDAPGTANVSVSGSTLTISRSTTGTSRFSSTSDTRETTGGTALGRDTSRTTPTICLG